MTLTFFSQETRASCTVACLRMVLAHWGIVENEERLCACCRMTAQGTTAGDAVACAQKYGLSAQELRNVQWNEIQHWLQAGIYPIALLNLFPLQALWVRHAVVIESVHSNTVNYLDPTYGAQSADLAAFNQAWQMNRKRAIVIRR